MQGGLWSGGDSNGGIRFGEDGVEGGSVKKDI